MANDIQTWMLNQYSANVDMLMQQKRSRLLPYVRKEDQRGLMAFWDQYGKTNVVEELVRHEATPVLSVEFFRRATVLRDWKWATLISPNDLLRMISDVTSPVFQAAGAAMQRNLDERLIDAALGSALQDDGTNTQTTVPVALSNSQKIAVGWGGGNEMTLAKLLRAKSMLKKQEPDDGTKFVLVCAQAQIDDMLDKINQVGSVDYNATKPFVEGDVHRFLGFDIVTTELLPYDAGTGQRTCFAFMSGALLLASGEEVTKKLTERDDLSYSVQPFMKASFGATRMLDKGVVQITCQSPSDS